MDAPASASAAREQAWPVWELVLTPEYSELEAEERARRRQVSRAWAVLLSRPEMWPGYYSGLLLAGRVRALLREGRREAAGWLLRGPFATKIEQALREQALREQALLHEQAHGEQASGRGAASTMDGARAEPAGASSDSDSAASTASSGSTDSDCEIRDVPLPRWRVQGRPLGPPPRQSSKAEEEDKDEDLDEDLEIKDVVVPAAGWAPGRGGEQKPRERSPYLLLADDAARRWGGRCLSRNWNEKEKELYWQCARSHIWEAPWRAVVEDYEWCGDCPDTGREEKCRIILQAMLGHVFPKVRPAFLCNAATGYPLELDGYSEILNLGFEHQGRQHYMVVPLFHPRGEADLAEQCARDQKKMALCEQNRTALLIIPYFVSNIAAWIKRALCSMGFLRAQ
jgi:hypothetical protein